MRRMVTIFLILGYIPVAGLTVYFYLAYSRRKKREIRVPERPQQFIYPLIEQQGTEDERGLLEDDPLDSKAFDMEKLKNKICELLEREKLYLNPNIRVSDVAKLLFTNKNYVAQAIKSRMGKNFCQLVHYYRIKEAIRVFSLSPDIQMQELAHRVGFNSMTTFNGAFSRNTGYTPAEWCKEYKRKNTKDYAA